MNDYLLTLVLLLLSHIILHKQLMASWLIGTSGKRTVAIYTVYDIIHVIVIILWCYMVLFLGRPDIAFVYLCSTACAIHIFIRYLISTIFAKHLSFLPSFHSLVSLYCFYYLFQYHLRKWIFSDYFWF